VKTSVFRARPTCVLAGLLAICGGIVITAQAPTLTTASGPVLRVATEGELQTAITQATPQTTIQIQPGQYRLSDTLLLANADHVTLTGATDNPADVVLLGVDAADTQTSRAASGLEIGSPNVTVANLSLQGFRDTAITISEGASAPHLSNVVVSDSAHLIRIESSALGTSSQGLIERSRFTASSAAQVLDGIAITGGKGWVVRGNRFEGIKPLEPNGGTVRVDGNATGVVIEGNVFSGSQREIVIGTPGTNGAAAIVRNNFIVRQAADDSGDRNAPIQVTGDLATVIVQNTVLTRGTADAALSTGGSDTPAAIANNLTDAPIDLTGSRRATTSHNDSAATPDLFVNPSSGDLHLTSAGRQRVPRVPRLSQAPTDVDGESRPASAEPGADTFVAASASPASTASSSATADSTAITLAAPSQDVTAAAVTAEAVPSPWLTRDIGSPSLAGDATYASSVFTLKGAGSDIGGTSDQFRFVYQPLSGDGKIVARVTGLTNTHAWAKAGLMIREGLASNARHFSAFVTPTSGIAGRRRNSVGGSTTSFNTSGGIPVWLKVARAGSTLTAYRSTDGASWTNIGSTSISMTGTIYVGLATTSHVTSKTTTATFTNVSVTSGTNNSPPTVSVSAPGTSFTAPATFVLTATAADSDGIARVDLFQGSTLLKSDTSSPYSVSVDSLAPGSYSFTAIAYDTKGAAAASSALTVTVTGSTGLYPTKVTFTPSADDAVVTNYVFEVFASTANPNTAAPIATKNLGKPVPSGGIDTADVGTTIGALAPGNYIATVSAVGVGGSSRSSAASFTR